MNRAVAYELIGDIDRAVEDYSKTIGLEPENAAAYDKRGRAYARKGDYTRPLADETKSSELAAQIAAQSRAPKTAVILPTHTHGLDRRRRFTMWWCCPELMNCRPPALRHSTK
jgi:tetratricopeptide (TPR) repeat protein